MHVSKIRMSLFFDQGFSKWRTLFISTTSNCHIFFCLFLNFLFKFFLQQQLFVQHRDFYDQPQSRASRISRSKIRLKDCIEHVPPGTGWNTFLHTQSSERRLAHSYFRNLVLLKWTPLLNNDLLSGYDGMKSRFRTPSIRCKG